MRRAQGGLLSMGEKMEICNDHLAYLTNTGHQLRERRQIINALLGRVQRRRLVQRADEKVKQPIAAARIHKVLHPLSRLIILNGKRQTWKAVSEVFCLVGRRRERVRVTLILPSS